MCPLRSAGTLCGHINVPIACKELSHVVLISIKVWGPAQQRSTQGYLNANSSPTSHWVFWGDTHNPGLSTLTNCGWDTHVSHITHTHTCCIVVEGIYGLHIDTENLATFVLCELIKVHHMWQSRVEIEHYIPLRISIALLRSKHCSVELPLRAGFIHAVRCKRGKYWWVYPVRMSSTLNESSALEHIMCSYGTIIHILAQTVIPKRFACKLLSFTIKNCTWHTHKLCNITGNWWVPAPPSPTSDPTSTLGPPDILHMASYRRPSPFLYLKFSLF